MSKRSTRTLYRKLTAIEIDTEQQVISELDVIAQTAERVIRRKPEAILLVSEDALFTAIDMAVGWSIVLLDRFTEESAFAVARDMRAVGSNLGKQAEIAEAMETWNPFGWTEGAKQVMEKWRLTAKTEFSLELMRQYRVSATQDESIVDGLLLRVYSKEKLGMIGRPGIGLLYSVQSACETIQTTVAWQMVNTQRSDAMHKVGVVA